MSKSLKSLNQHNKNKNKQDKQGNQSIDKSSSQIRRKPNSSKKCALCREKGSALFSCYYCKMFFHPICLGGD
jgi:hypothetical protein